MARSLEFLHVPLGKYLDEAAHESARAARRLWWLIAALALLAIVLTSMSA